MTPLDVMVWLFAVIGLFAVAAVGYFGMWYARIVWFARKPQPLAPLEGGRKRHVVITGCDTGLGKLAAAALAAKPGFHVHGLCLTQEAATSLSALNNATGIVCDVTDASQVAAAVQRVKVVTPSIWGLVNNAGVSGGVEAQFTDVSITERVMRVNYFGSIRVALGFLPLLQAHGKSRVIQIGSAAGRCNLGGVSTYGSSKAAITNWMVTFGVEQNIWGIDVAILEPAHVKTPMAENVVTNVARAYENLPDDVKTAFGPKYFGTRIGVAKWKVGHADPASVVVDKIVDGLTLDEPLPTRNLVGSAQQKLTKLGWMPFQWQFDAMVQMFNGPVVPAVLETEDGDKKAD